jgi:hypothetical protein
MRTNAASVTAIMSRMRFCRIARVPAPEIETLVCEGVRRHLATTSGAELSAAHADRELIERHVACVIIKPQALEVCLIPMCEAVARTEDPPATRRLKQKIRAFMTRHPAARQRLRSRFPGPRQAFRP